MIKGKMKLIFAEIMHELKAYGYHVSPRLMNAMYFGVPQSRQRMIFIGVREDLWENPSSLAASFGPKPVSLQFHRKTSCHQHQASNKVTTA